MKKLLKSAFSFVLAGLMCMSACAASADAGAVVTEDLPAVKADAPNVDPTLIDRVIVNMRDEESFADLMNIYSHTPTAVEPDPNTGGVYRFDDELQAMELVFSENKRQPDWRGMFRFNKKDSITENHKYFVIVYSVITEGEYRMTVWNSPACGDELVIAENGKDTGGFTVSEPFDISKPNAVGKLQDRWLTTNMNTLGIESADKNLKFYIKEFGFFTSAEDAKAYYANVDINKYPPEIDEEAINEANLPAPVGIKFDTTINMMQNGFGYFTKDGEITSANYSAVDLNGVKAIKLNYVNTGKWSPYVVMPNFTSAGRVTDQHKYARIVYMTTDPAANSITLRSNASGHIVTLAGNTAESRGEWVVSQPVDISGDILTRFASAKHNTLQFMSESPDSQIYIKELMFFASLKQAGDYYGDTVAANQSLTFGDGSNSAFFSGDNYGVYDVNTKESTVDIKYAESTNMKTNFCCKIKFAKKQELRTNYKYARILYRATIPTGQDRISMKFYNDGGGDLSIFSSTVKDTAGEFVLTKTVELSSGMIARLQSGMHASLYLDCTDKDAVFSIKAVYFFPTKSVANSFEVDSTRSEITLNGADITGFKIVVPASSGDQVMIAANLIAARIRNLTGAALPVVTDKEAPAANEILIGNTNRPLSASLEASLTAYDSYAAKVEGTELAISAKLAANLTEAVKDFMRNFLYDGLDNPEKITLDNSTALSGTTANMVPFTEWTEPENVPNPIVIADDFDTDSGYFTEEANTSIWKLENGAYSANTAEYALNYVHVYEKNVDFEAKMSYKTAGADGKMGIVLRYTGTDAFLRAGYDFAVGEWFIESREGNDFSLIRKASAKAELIPDAVYDLKFTANGRTAALFVNGTAVASSDDIDQTSPGLPGFFAENANVSVDSVKITLLSGEGTPLKNVTHLKIDNGMYTEGGSAWELNDGTVHFEHSLVAYKSLDKGYTWEKTEKRMGVNGYPTMIRLNDGSLIRTNSRANLYITAEISTDEGATWTEVGIITDRYWHVTTTAGAGNMNDKMFQSPTTGRIFYSQNYESQKGPVEGRYVFCEFFYSDDNGKTWIKSETDSWELPGNETQTHFGECKMLECSDGTIRIYNSWNPTGNIQYTESHDNGVTWGPLTPLEGFRCTQSSMQFVRDPYADNDHTYYMVWINNVPTESTGATAPRGRLSLAKTTDGKNWTVIGDVWRWESGYFAPGTKALINQIVDPFIIVTEKTIIVGSGISDQIYLASANDNTYHQAQRENIWCIDKDNAK